MNDLLNIDVCKSKTYNTQVYIAGSLTYKINIAPLQSSYSTYYD